MTTPDCASAYIDAVLAGVGWKRAHAVIRRELSGHIEDQCAAYEEETGMSHTQALRSAVADMGDAALVGARLNAAYRPATPWGLVIPLLLLAAAGLLLRFVPGLPRESAVPDGLLAFPLSIALSFLLLRMDLYRLSGHGALCYGCCALAIVALCLLRCSGLFALPEEQAGLWRYPALLLPTAYACFLYDLRGGGLSRLLVAGAALAVPMVAIALLPSAVMLVYLGVPCLALLVLPLPQAFFNANERLR